MVTSPAVSPALLVIKLVSDTSDRLRSNPVHSLTLTRNHQRQISFSRYILHTAVNIHAWQPSAAHSTREYNHRCRPLPRRGGLICTPSPISDIIRRGYRNREHIISDGSIS